MPTGLDSTLIESRRNTSISMLLESLVSTPTEFPTSPLYVGRLSLLSPYFFFFIFQRTVHRHLFISEAEEGSTLIERRRGCIFREVFNIYL